MDHLVNICHIVYNFHIYYFGSFTIVGKKITCFKKKKMFEEQWLGPIISFAE